MSQYTPGPWSVEQDCQGFYNVVCDGKGFDRYVIGCEGLYRRDDADRANASLISAAPELLEALKLALDHLDTLYPTARGDDFLVDTCVAAIAKATGEAP